MSSTNNSPKDIFAVYQQNVDKCIDSIKKSVPQYHQAISNVQQEYLQAVENLVNSSFTTQKETSRRAGITSNIPEATLKVIDETTEQLLKGTAVNNQVALAAINATQQNIKTFNDNAKTFADMNKNIMQSWISTFTPSK